jgi:hypothetical protein
MQLKRADCYLLCKRDPMKKLLSLLFCCSVIFLGAQEAEQRVIAENSKIFTAYLESSREQNELIQDWVSFLESQGELPAETESIDCCLREVFWGADFAMITRGEYDSDIFTQVGLKVPFSLMQLAVILGRIDLVEMLDAFPENIRAKDRYNSTVLEISVLMNLDWLLDQDDPQKRLYGIADRDWDLMREYLEAAEAILAAAPQDNIDAIAEQEEEDAWREELGILLV